MTGGVRFYAKFVVNIDALPPKFIKNDFDMLFSPLTLRSITAKNRLVISPMCNYSAIDGYCNDWHLVTLGRYAQGGAGIVFVEASAVQANGRITHGDVGIWADEHIAGLKRIADFIRAQGSVPAIQLGHAGRKASMARPWYGNGPLTQADIHRGDLPWDAQAPSASPVASGWILPTEMSLIAIAQLKSDFVTAAIRCEKAGFDIVELHAAHGYLLHSFLSPISNQRRDTYGGDRQGRSRLIIEIAREVRAVWPLDKPLFVRFSAVDDLDQGWEIDDSIWLAAELKAVGVDVIDCSSGGILGAATSPGAAGVVPKTKRVPGFQVPWAKAIKQASDIKTMAVGLILTPEQADSILKDGAADLVAIAREALRDPNWPVNAAYTLGIDKAFEHWPVQFGWWLNVRQPTLDKLGLTRQ
jgi:2,4-dienoyl-CoA reductase-like NADH-dependent reductase (Old Yellow Enzyme family)